MTASLDRTDLASATLLVLSGPARGSRIEVPAGGLVFGRAAGSASRLGDDQALSRWHARLDLDDEVLVVEDLASTNGTLLNGQPISGRQPVRPGDVVTVGTSQLQALPPPTTAPAQLRTLATGLLPAVAAPAAPPAARPPAAAVGAPAAAKPAPHPPAAAPAAAVPPAHPPAAAPAAARPPAAPAGPVPPAAHPPAAAPAAAAAPPAARPPAVAMPPAAPQAGRQQAPRQQPAWPSALAQPELPPGAGSPVLAELPDVHPLFLAIAGRYLGRVIAVYTVVAVLLGVLAALLEIVRYHYGVTLPAAVMPGQWAKPVAGLLALSSGGLALVACLRTASTRLSLQAGRLDIERGVLRREATAIDLRQLRRVTLHQTALRQLTGDGTLLLELADHAGPIPVTGLARGQQLQQIYRQLAALTSASHR